MRSPSEPRFASLAFRPSSARPYSHLFFFFNDTATTEIYTLSLHDALPILIPGRALGGGAHLFHRRAGQRREDVAGACRASCVRRQLFAMGIEHPGAADRRKNERQVECGAHHGGADIARRCWHRASGPERQILECPRVSAECHLIVGTAVDVVEHDGGESSFCETTEVRDVQNAWCLDRTGHEVQILLVTCPVPRHQRWRRRWR